MAGVHRKEIKLKEVMRLGGFYVILTKEKKFWLKEMINCGTETGKYKGELMEDKGYFDKVCLYRLISMPTLHLQ